LLDHGLIADAVSPDMPHTTGLIIDALRYGCSAGSLEQKE
jgi:hypothetical protein